MADCPRRPMSGHPQALDFPEPSVPLFARVDPATHPMGWGYDLIAFVWLAEALALPTEGNA
jgi:hypothetical protein